MENEIREAINKANKRLTIRGIPVTDVQMEFILHSVVKALSITAVSQRSELLPDFLYESNGGIKVGVHGDSDVTEEWNEYLKKIR
jgi:hypothetical protein